MGKFILKQADGGSSLKGGDLIKGEHNPISIGDLVPIVGLDEKEIFATNLTGIHKLLAWRVLGELNADITLKLDDDIHDVDFVPTDKDGGKRFPPIDISNIITVKILAKKKSNGGSHNFQGVIYFD